LNFPHPVIFIIEELLHLSSPPLLFLETTKRSWLSGTEREALRTDFMRKLNDVVPLCTRIGVEKKVRRGG